MSWTPPRTWTDTEEVTPAIFNAHVRDNLALLATQVDALGCYRTALACFAYSSGQGNVTTGDTHLTSFDVTVPAGFLSQPGDALEVHGVAFLAANANAKYLRLKMGGGTEVTLFSTSANVASHQVPFRYVLRYRSSTTGSLFGYATVGATTGAIGSWTIAAPSAGLGTVAWGNSQALAFYAQGTATNDLVLGDLTVCRVTGVTGVTV